jgi:hypothetical protein
VFTLDDIAGGIGEFDLFDNIGFVSVFESHDIAGGIAELDLFDNIGFV